MHEEHASVVGVFDDYQSAERAVGDLTKHGIPRDAIEIKSNDATSTTASEHTGESEGFFAWLFGSDEDESGNYAEAVRRGSAIVSVSASQQTLERAADILNAHGAVDIDQRVATYRETGYERHDPSAPAYTAEQAKSERERYRGQPERKIPIVEEELQVGKRAIRRGGVRIYSRVIEEPVHEEVHLREERVHVERHPVDRPLSAGEMAGLRDQTVEMQETVEEPVVSKRARVKEEVTVGTQTSERVEHVRDTVRRTDVKVEPMGEGSRDWTEYRDEFRRDYDTRFGKTGSQWASMEPAYQYGYRMANDPRYHGKSWSEIEAQMRSGYERDHSGSTWDSVKDAVRYGWEKVSGKR